MGLTPGPADRLQLPPEALRRRVDSRTLGFRTTAEVAPMTGTFNQDRAMTALSFGVGIPSRGYNLFVSGVSGTGRTGMVRTYLEPVAASRLAPDDWLYVHNFDRPDRPLALNMPAGMARTFAADMDGFLEQARVQISRAFESERYAERRQQLGSELARKRAAALAELDDFVKARSFGVEVSPAGIATAPMVDGRPMRKEELEGLDAAARAELERHGGEVQHEVGTTMQRLSQLERDGASQLAALDREIAQFAIEPVLLGLRSKYSGLPAIVAHLERIAEDIPIHLPDFRHAASEEATSPLEAAFSSDRISRYRANVVVDNSASGGAPVVVETNPTYYNLIGRVEYRATFGTMVTDFRQVKAGALHRANGGFLILDASDVLANPFTWPALIRALSTRQIRIENLGEQFSAIPTASISPEPIPLSVKVVLVGTPMLYQVLFELDEEFRELFKVRVDFAPEVDWTDEAMAGYAAFIARCVVDRGLIHFGAEAVARVIEECARWRDSQRKLSTRLRDLDDLVTEASYWAQQRGHSAVMASDVRHAVVEKGRRSSFAEERLRELITDGTIQIEIAGSRVGQLNGLSVIELGDHRFGAPSRISATASLGRGTIESIERETKLGGRLHNKGFLIVAGYLASTYTQRWPLALNATLTFEQSYDEVEGDSASSTELYALLSALAGVPLKQSIAVTGSVDQHGNVQAIGGVNDKVEGFFKVCKAKGGLSGDQGVIIPAANRPDLMLDEEVVDAVAEGRFHIWSVVNVDQGIEILTGLAAGERTGDGDFPAGSVHRLVSDRLQEYARVHASYAAHLDGASPAGVKTGTERV